MVKLLLLFHLRVIKAIEFCRKTSSNTAIGHRAYFTKKTGACLDVRVCLFLLIFNLYAQQFYGNTQKGRGQDYQIYNELSQSTITTTLGPEIA